MVSWTAEAGLCINPSDEITILASVILLLAVVFLILDSPPEP